MHFNSTLGLLNIKISLLDLVYSRSEYVRNLPEEQLKKETKVETRNDTLSALIQSLKMILQRAPQDKYERDRIFILPVDHLYQLSVGVDRKITPCS